MILLYVLLIYFRSHLYPPARLYRFFHRLDNALVPQPVLETRRNRFSLHAPIDEIGHGMHESVFVAQRMPRPPPLAYIGVDAAGLRHQDVPEALPVGRRPAIVEFEPVHVFEIEAKRPRRAIDLEQHLVLPSRRAPRR